MAGVPASSSGSAAASDGKAKDATKDADVEDGEAVMLSYEGRIYVDESLEGKWFVTDMLTLDSNDKTQTLQINT